jgi:ribosome biogenesis GTPase
MWTLKSLACAHCFQNSKWFGEQRVGTVSKKSGKGKHTTRHVSLLPIVDGGFLADTPGFNQPSLMKLTKQGLAETFPEVCSLDALLL